MKEPDYCYDPLDKYLPTKEDWDTFYEWKDEDKTKKHRIMDPTKCYTQEDWDSYTEWKNNCEDRKKE
mgnify:FL=1